MSRLVDAMPLLIVIAVCVLVYFYADQLFMFLYDLSGLISKLL